MSVLIVNTDTVPGKSIKQVLGLVCYNPTHLDRSTRYIIDSLSKQAEDMGANAIIKFTLNSNISVSDDQSHDLIIAYGTAVVIEE